MYTGLLSMLRGQPDGLAAVMGHEMAHALCEHTAEKMSLQTVFLGLNAAVLTAIFAWFDGGLFAAGVIQQVARHCQSALTLCWHPVLTVSLCSEPSSALTVLSFCLHRALILLAVCSVCALILLALCSHFARSVLCVCSHCAHTVLIVLAVCCVCSHCARS